MISFLDSNILKKFLPVFIFLFAFCLRIYGINWDQNQHLHPDERFLTMTVDAMTWPKTLSEYLNPSLSKLNPYNIGTGFFVYGTFPTTIVKYFSRFELFGPFQYNNIALTGRLISAIFDVGVVILVFLMASRVSNRSTGLTAAFLYSISVLPIQLSHFYAVDTLLNFFLVLSFYFLIQLISKKGSYYSVLLGLSYGLALACKISALYFLPVILLGLIFFLFNPKNLKLATYLPAVVCATAKALCDTRLTKVGCLLLIALCAYASFRIFDPHSFSGGLLYPKISPQFIQNIKQLRFFENPNALFPPAIQWLKITSIVFPLKNIVLWGLGLPLGILSLVAVIYSIYSFGFIILPARQSFSAGGKDCKQLKNLCTLSLDRLSFQQISHLLILFWVIFLFLYQGIQFSPSMRYFLPIYPLMAVITANFSITYLFPKFKKSIILYTLYTILILIWPFSFLAIYSHPHSRVLASEWIYKNIPPGSTLSCDAWDDCLPLSIEKVGYASQYKILSLEPFAPDTPEKWNKFNDQLNKIDYLVLSSNRVWGSVPKVPDKYPLTSKFYNDLFAGKLNFTKVAEITSYPTIPILNIPIPDQSSEEAFTVYDHPKVLIYKKI